MRIAALTCVSLMLYSPLALAQEKPSDDAKESPGPNGPNISVNTGGGVPSIGLLGGLLISPRIAAGSGLGDRWRVDLELSAGATQLNVSANGENLQQTNIQINPALSVQALFPVSRRVRTYAGGRLSTTLSFQEQNGESLSLAGNGVNLGIAGVLGGELVVGERFAFGLEVGLGGSVNPPQEREDVRTSGWSVQTNSRLSARYYF